MLDNLSVTTASLALALAISVIALGLVLWLRFERSTRDESLSDADHQHFSRQDVRRNAGLAILFFLAQGIAISPRVELRLGGRPNPMFVVLWLAVSLLILLLLGLAFVDMMATRVYARRHREAILRERSNLLSQIEQIAHGRRADEGASNSDADRLDGRSPSGPESGSFEG